MSSVQGHHGAIASLSRGGAPWWQIAGQTCVAAYQPKGVASLAASYTNLANPGTHNAAPGVAPTWAPKTGWKGNGTSTYLTTGLLPASGWSMFVRFSGVVAESAYLAGSTDGTNRFFLAGRRFNRSYFGQGCFVHESIIYAGTIGVANQHAYVAGAQIAAIGAWTGGASEVPILLLGLNDSGTPKLFTEAYMQAVAIYSTDLTHAEAVELTARMTAL